MAEAVLDASALLALLANEPGAESVGAILGSGTVLMSAVNLCEVLAKLGDRGVPEHQQQSIVTSLDIDTRPFDEASAWRAAGLRKVTRAQGLSIGDRACLALALQTGLPALTADRAWAGVELGIEIRVIR